MGHGSADDNVVLPLASLERLLERRRAEDSAPPDDNAPKVVIRVGETTLAEAERLVIQKTLEAHSGHKGNTAKALKISAPKLLRKLRAYEAASKKGDVA